MPDVFEKLAKIFKDFPGIGPRQARRFVYHLLGRSESQLKEFSDLVGELKKLVKTCSLCCRFHSSGAAVCAICRDKGRDRSTLLVISKDSDLSAIEQSGVYKGLYFVLGGTVPILEKEPERKIRIRELLAQILERVKKDKLREIIISMNVNPEGENTASYLRSRLEKLVKEHSLKLAAPGRGLSTGLELEYSDPETIKNALERRSGV